MAEAAAVPTDEPATDVTLEALQAANAALLAEKEALLNKNNELLGESKKAKEARRTAEAQAAETAKKKAEAEGNYEQLFKSSEAEREKTMAELDDLRGQTAKEKVKGEALKLATTLADGTNVELLAEFIERRLRYSDGGVKVTDNNGDLTVSSLQDLAKEFTTSGRYSSLLKGSQASGGGAVGGSNKAGGQQQIARAEWDSMDSVARSKFAKSGGKVV